MNERQDDSNSPADETDSLFPAIPQDKPSHLTPRFQFKISTLISWMAVISAVLVTADLGEFFGSGSEGFFQTDPSEKIFTLIVLGLFLFPALTCIPTLVNNLLG